MMGLLIHLENGKGTIWAFNALTYMGVPPPSQDLELAASDWIPQLLLTVSL